MNPPPLFSIVTPSYNQARFLESAMHSVLAQDYPSVEYFVVDGGSNDGSVEIIQRLADKYRPRLKWWVSEKDQGQADAINKGLKRASGEIIAWLNSDDVYLRDAFKKVARFFEQDNDVGLLYTNVISINERDEIINIMRFQPWGLADLMAFNIISQPGVFLRRGALESVGWLDIDYHMLLDHQLWLRIANKYPIAFLDDCLAAARFHPQAKNYAQTEKFSREAFRLLEWMSTAREMEEVYRANEKKIRAGVHSFSARYLQDAGLNREAVKNYFRCARLHLKTALRSLHRWLFAMFSLVLPLDGLKKIFLAHKKKRAIYDGKQVLEKWWEDGEQEQV